MKWLMVVQHIQVLYSRKLISIYTEGLEFHLRPIWNPDTADLIGDPWIRQGLNPSVDETLLPKRKIKIRNKTNCIKGELVKKMLRRKIQVNLKTKDIPVRCKWTVSLTRLLEIVLLLNDDLWCWKQILAHGHHHNKFN